MPIVEAIPKLVTVFGGSGFVGRHVVRALAKRGYRVRVAVRRPDLAGFVQPAGNVGQIQPVQANIRVRWSIDRAVEGSDYVINLVGIAHESGRQTFAAVQDFGARAIAESARAAGAGMTQISAIGANEHSESDYAKSKAAGEAAVLAALPDATIIRPSMVFGPEDKFFNRFANMARYSPVLPLVGAETKFQPVYVGDVAEAIARSVEGKMAGGVYELGGPEALTFRECMERMLGIIERKRWVVNTPWPVASLMGSLLGWLPNPPITSDQVEMLRHNNVVSHGAKEAGRSLEGLGIEARSIDAILPSYLWTYRVAGQFTNDRLA